MAQICPECGTSNSDNATICKKCGSPLPGAVATNAANNGAPKTPAVTPGATTKTKPPSGAIAEAARRAAAQQRAAQQAATPEGVAGAGTTTPRTRASGEPISTIPRRTGAAAAPTGTVSRRLNRALDDAGLPRFSTRRYLVIWAGVLVLILGTLALLIATGAAENQVAVPTPLAGAATTGKFATIETITGTIKLELNEDAKMARTVKNFRDKVASGFYNGLTFHRVEDWLAQGGDPKGTGQGGSSIVGEYIDKPFVRGAVGMASQGPHASRVNDAQFFIVKTDRTTLNGNYANFATVVEGMDVVDKIKIGDKIDKISLSDK